MKSVLISIRPEYCAKIASGKKTLEIRKTRPKLDTPFKCYIYCTKGNYELFYNQNDALSTEEYINGGHKCNGKVIGEFVCDGFLSHCEMANADIAEQQGLIKREKLFEYANGKELYGWHISDLVRYDEPKELSEFGIKRPPQSWQYIDEVTE